MGSSSLILFLVKIMKVILVLVIFLITYLLMDKIKDYNFQSAIEKGMNTLTEKEKMAAFKIKQMEYYVSKKKKHKYLNKLQMLILKSNVNEKLKILTPEIVIFISAILAVSGFILGRRYLDLIFPSLLIGVFFYRIPTFILELLTEVQNFKINKNLVEFMNILINFCGVKNDIVYSINSSIPFIKKPISNYCESFIYETKHGISPYDALENFKEKVDNKQFKLMIKNLQLCSIYSNQYLEVLKKSKDLILKYNKEHARKRNEAKIGRVSILILVTISLIIFKILLLVNPSLINILKTTPIGKILINYIVAVCLISFQIVIKLSKFDY